MPHTTRTGWICLIATILFFPGQEQGGRWQRAYAGPSGVDTVHKDPAVTSTHALGCLQEFHRRDATTFVEQKELDCLIDKAGGGGCASAAGIDTFQALRLMAGLDKLPNPHKAVLASIADQPSLLKGHVTNDQFERLIKFYGQYSGNLSLNVDIVSAPNSTYRGADGKTWSKDLGPDFTVDVRAIQVLSYTVSEPNGKVRGRHFVLLKTIAKGQVEVVDPSSPLNDRRYVLEYRKDGQGPGSRVFLLNPAEIPRRDGLVYELNTVFTLSLGKKAVGENGKSASAVSVEILKKRIDEVASQFNDTPDFLDPRAWRRRTAEFGLPGLDLPAAYGGSDWPAVKMIEVFRHAGQHNLNLRDVVGGAHVRLLLKSKNKEILDIVRQVATGAGYIAITITEPGSGSDFTAMKSTAKKVEGGYRLTGEKRFNARLDQATHVIVFTQASTGKKGQLSAFVLPINTKGLTVTRFFAHGLTANSYGGLELKDVFVKDDYLLGSDGDGSRLFFEHFLYWRLMQAAAAIGTGEKALSLMADRIKERHAFGGPIGRFTHLQQQIGQHTTELRMAFALAREAAALLDGGKYKDAQPLISGLKAEGVEIALKASDAAMRAFGGEGYSNKVDLGDRVRDLMGLRIADGTTDVLRMDVVRRTYGEVFWEMAIQPKSESH